TKSEKIIHLTNHYPPHNYLPFPILISQPQALSLKHPQANKYIHILSPYSPLNQPHTHPKIIQPLKHQPHKLTLLSPPFHTHNLPQSYQKISKLPPKHKPLPMNTPPQAVET
ncbi:aminotransferase class III-fold pyridoxal phosphate-dependent enzyme, partial [Staphylococcus aureus]|uniref:aminotransferase class III-fold pyridoxal phosphate-dependent enzyme n=1 Tax=Staphylococcus aureus TaxID=1280 RepID=UPI00119D4E87